MVGYEIAKKYKGLHEVRDNRTLRKILTVDPADTAWCADFVNFCEHEVGHPGTGRLLARSFLKYGKPIELKNAKKGDIIILGRGGSAWQGHVAYLDGIEQVDGKTLIRTLGGNQSNSVSISWYPIERLLGIRRYEQ